MSKVTTQGDENFGKSQEELQKFVQEQKRENTVKKVVIFKCFYHFISEIKKTMTSCALKRTLKIISGVFFNFFIFIVALKWPYNK